MDEIRMEYDEGRREIYVVTEGERTVLYTNADRREFNVISEIDELVSEATVLSHKINQSILKREVLIQEEEYFSLLTEFQEEAGSYYEDCQELQATTKDSGSGIVEAQLDLLYKLDKFLQHYFRQISIAQSLGFSQRLIFSHLATQDYVFLYGFTRNACSTLEYLGKLLESRRGEGIIGLNNEGVNFKKVYKELNNQGLDETLEERQKIKIPGKDKYMQMGNVGLDESEMDFLWKKRNAIVHHCPVVVKKGSVDHLPRELLTTAILTKSDTERLTELASRVHVHSIGMFLNFSMSYIEELLEKRVESWYYENPSSRD